MKIGLGIVGLLLFCLGANTQTVVMKIANITPAEGEPVLAFDWKVKAETSLLSGGGASVAKPVPEYVLIKKSLGVSNASLMTNLLKGTVTNVTFEWFSADNANTPYYKVELLQAYVSQFYHLSPECPTCININFQVGFVPKEVRMYDLKNCKTVNWNIANMTVN